MIVKILLLASILALALFLSYIYYFSSEGLWGLLDTTTPNVQNNNASYDFEKDVNKEHPHSDIDLEDNDDTEFNEFGQKVWKWSRPKRNILFIKVPKTGGTTVAESLARLAKHSTLPLVRPEKGVARIDTCGSEGSSEQAWVTTVTHNGGKLGTFASHACYRKFMKNSRFWSLDHVPKAITLMREPWHQFISKYRFTEVCCEFRHWPWCETICPKDIKTGVRLKFSYSRFVQTCTNDRCNDQTRYIGEGNPKNALGEYVIVLLLERLDEGLALLLVKVGIPFKTLPYLKQNENLVVSIPNFTKESREYVETHFLKSDVTMYRLATQRFNMQLANLNRDDRKLFEFTLQKLKTVNEKLQRVCYDECISLTEMTAKRKACDEECIERELKLVDD